MFNQNLIMKKWSDESKLRNIPKNNGIELFKNFQCRKVCKRQENPQIKEV